MTNTSKSLLDYIRVIAGAWREDPRDDAQLLTKFVENRDEEAFIALLWRHGQMVWRTCSRVLGNGPDTEDAFQVTFLCLSRKAGQLRAATLAGWLHRVARQTALNMKIKSRKCQSFEHRLRTVAQLVSEEEDASHAELYVALDEELARLPERLRVPLILRYLESKTQEEVAHILGCSRNAALKRLARGEAILRQRLERRGLTVGIGTVAVLLGSAAGVPGVPTRLIISTVRATLCSLSFPLPLESSPSAALAEGMMKHMGMTKAKLVAVLLGLTLGLAGGGVLAYRALAGNVPEPPPPAGQARGKAEAPRQSSSDRRATARLDRLGDPLPEGALARLGTVRLYMGEVYDVAFSPDGKMVAVAGNDKTVRLCEVATGKEIRTLHGHKTNVWEVAFSSDGKTVATGDALGTVRLWEVADGKTIRTLDLHKGWVRSVAFSSDGKTVATGGGKDGMVRLWEMATGKEIHTLKGHKEQVSALAFSPDGKMLASKGWHGSMHLWEVATGKKIHTLMEGGEDAARAYAVAFSPDSKAVASAVENGLVSMWETSTGKLIHTFKGHLCTDSIAFSPDGKTMVTGGSMDGTVHLWETSTGKGIRALWGGRRVQWVKKVVFSPDGKIIASGGEDGVVHLWKVATSKPIHILQGHDGWVRAVAFLPDGKTVATGGEDGAVRLWEASTGKPIRILQGHNGGIGVVAFSPDGKTVASGGEDGIVRLQRSTTGKEILTQRGHKGPVLSVALSPDGKTVASGGSDLTVRLWKVATGEEIRTLQGHRNHVISVAFSPDGKTVASGGKGGTICLWDVATGNEIRRVRGTGWIWSLAFSPDGKTVATGEQEHKTKSGGMVRLWEAATGGEIRILGYSKVAIGDFFCLGAVAFSPDGRTLAATSGDCVKLWDLPSGTALPTLAGHRGQVLGMRFSPDGRTLASVSGDTTGLIWKLTSRAARPVTKQSPDALRALWADLASPNAWQAWRAVWALAATPEQSVPLLRDRLRPVPPPDMKRLARLVADLDAADFKVRERAGRELERLGAVAESALRKSLEERPSVELRRRLKQLLEAVEAQNERSFSKEVLPGLRAVAVLEQIGTPEAREVLKTLAAGAPRVRLTEEAQAALRRLIAR